MGPLLGFAALLLVIVGTPGAIALGALFGWRLTEGRPRTLRLAVSWGCGAVLCYFFAMAWFAPPILAAGDTDPSTRVFAMSGSPAERAGVRSGDRVTRANGKKVESWDEIRNTLKANPPTETDEVELERGGRLLTLRI